MPPDEFPGPQLLLLELAHIAGMSVSGKNQSEGLLKLHICPAMTYNATLRFIVKRSERMSAERICQFVHSTLHTAATKGNHVNAPQQDSGLSVVSL